MRRCRLTTDEIADLLERTAAGQDITAACHQFRISAATYFRIKNQYSGMPRSAVERIVTLEREERQLRRVLGWRTRELEALQQLQELLLPATHERMEAARFLMEVCRLSERRACNLLQISRSTLRYRSQAIHRRARFAAAGQEASS